VAGQSLSLALQADWTVLDVKRQLAPQVQIRFVTDNKSDLQLGAADPQELRIIFAGKELRDDVPLAACDLGNQSVLHAVRVVRCGQENPISHLSKSDLQQGGGDCG
jgi:parkin